MKIKEFLLYYYCRSGRYGAQIPLVPFDQSATPTAEPIVDIPDDWVIRVDTHLLPVVARHSYLYWSRKGFAENEARLRAAFKTSEGYRTGEPSDMGHSFESWKNMCEQDWQRIEKSVTQQVRLLRTKVDLYDTFLRESRYAIFLEGSKEDV